MDQSLIGEEGEEEGGARRVGSSVMLAFERPSQYLLTHTVSQLVGMQAAGHSPGHASPCPATQTRTWSPNLESRDDDGSCRGGAAMPCTNRRLPLKFSFQLLFQTKRMAHKCIAIAIPIQ